MRLLDHLRSSRLLRKLMIISITLVAVPVVLFMVAYISGQERRTQETAVTQVQADLRAEIRRIRDNFVLLRNAGYYLSRDSELVGQVADEEPVFFGDSFAKASYFKFANEIIYSINYFVGPDSSVADSANVFPFGDLIKKRVYEPMVESEQNQYWLMQDESLSLSSNTAKRQLVSVFTRVPGTPVPVLVEVSMLIRDLIPSLLRDFGDTFVIVRFDDGRSISSVREDDPPVWNAVANRIHVEAQSEQAASWGSFPMSEGGSRFQILFDFSHVIQAEIFYVLDLEQRLGALRRIRTVLLLVALGVMLLLSTVVSLHVARRLRDLATVVQHIRKVEAGDFDVSIPVEGNDEVVELARHFERMASRISDLVYEKSRDEAAAVIAANRKLSLKINTHFLYNALETIKMMALVRGEHGIEESLTTLGDLLRYSVSWQRQYVRLSEELAQIHNYLDLVNLRYDFTVTLNAEVSEADARQEIPKMCLQPLVENAVMHGIEQLGEDSEISVLARNLHPEFELVVIDHGAGMSLSELARVQRALRSPNEVAIGANMSHGLGLINVQNRIEFLCGEGHGITVESESGRGTKVTLNLPSSHKPVRGS